MTTATDFESQLDDNPSDWTLRSIYADWLEEQGDVFCETQRWMVANEKCPYRDPGCSWDWAVNFRVHELEHLIVDGRIYKFMLGDEHTSWKEYPTRHAAELDLHNALVKSGVITCALIEEVEA